MCIRVSEAPGSCYIATGYTIKGSGTQEEKSKIHMYVYKKIMIKL